jgi:hypothetical protein
MGAMDHIMKELKKPLHSWQVQGVWSIQTTDKLACL